MENWLRRRARLSPGRVGLRCDGRSFTFAELLAEVEWRAERLCGRGLAPERVGLLAENSTELVCWLLAVLSSGRQAVLLNTRLAGPELAAQVAAAEVGFLLGEPALLIHLAETSVPLLSFAEASWLPPRACGWPAWEDDAVATVMFTSGSTGRPKGIVQTFGNHAAAATGSVLNMGLDPVRDAWLAPTPLFHVSGLSVLLRCLLAGITCVVPRGFDAGDVAAEVRSGGATIVSVVPQMLRGVLAELDGPPAPGFRTFLLGGGFSEPEVIDACIARGIPVMPSFGMSETCAHVIACPPDAPPDKLHTAGQALVGTDLRIATTGEEHVGEIQLRSRAITPGFLGDEAGYDACWTGDGWFKTGDLGEVDAEGYLTVHARLSGLIISGGENVVPAEVEAVLRSHPDIVEAAVVGAPDERWGFVPVAFVVATAEPDPAAWDAFCRERLAHYKCPHRYVPLPELPRTAVGKVCTGDLEEAAAALVGAPAEPLAGEEPAADA